MTQAGSVVPTHRGRATQVTLDGPEAEAWLGLRAAIRDQRAATAERARAITGLQRQSATARRDNAIARKGAALAAILALLDEGP